MSLRRIMEKTDKYEREAAIRVQAHYGFDKQVEEMGLNQGAEVGVWYGTHIENLLKITKGKVYGIDPFSIYYQKNMILGMNQESIDTLYNFVVNKFDERYVPIRKPSVEAFDVLPDNLDYVYIDGDHSYEGVWDDMIYYLKVRKGGLFGGHDYFNKKFKGVGLAVDRFAKIIGKEVNTGKDSDWWIYV